MPKFLLSNIHTTGRQLSPAELQAAIERVLQVKRQMQDDKVWVFAMPLPGPEASTVVRADSGGVTFADGPFAEAKEYVGGFTVIDVDTLDAALAWAAKMATALGAPVEVRPEQTFGA